MGETPSLTGQFVGDKRGPRMHTNPPTQEAAQNGTLCLWVSGEVTENGQREEQVALFPLGPSPTYRITTQQCGLPHPGEHLRLCPLLPTGETKRKVTRMKEQIKAQEKIQLSDEERANLSGAQFKTLVIRKLTELVEYGRKLEEKMKAMLSEIKENAQGTNSDRKQTRTQINGVDQKEERNI